MSNETNRQADSGITDADSIVALASMMRDVMAGMVALAEAVQAQAVALHALADAIAAPVEDQPEVDNRPRYMDGSLIED